MIVNILKDTGWIDELEPYNAQLRQVHEKYYPMEGNDWFDPDKYRQNPLSRLYPELDPVINYRPDYKLIFYLPNYVPLFLVRELYGDKRDILIEDVGTGNGNLIYFLAKSGFKNFNTFENFSECPKDLFNDMMDVSGVTCEVNNLKVNPVVLNNSSSPRFCYIAPGIDAEGLVLLEDARYYQVSRDLSNVELICFYSNKHWEVIAPYILKPLGYSFLCRDTDHVGVAWCRNDKLKEFNEKLSKWMV